MTRGAGRQVGSSDGEILAGLVERVTFHNPENGFCVLRTKVRGHRDLVTVVDHAALVSPGEWITASGEWVNDRTHGQQFKSRFIRSSAPSSVEGIEKYLGSGMIRGIGPVYARKLIRAFGDKVFDVIEAESERLREVTGIGRVRARRITDAWAEQKLVREIMVFLHNHGVGTARAVRIFKTYGADAVEVMTDNPYRLARDIRGIGFRTADAIAMKLGIAKTAVIRVRAGIAYALTEAMDEGHCGLPAEELGPMAPRLLEVPDDLIRTALDLELAGGRGQGGGHPQRVPGGPAPVRTGNRRQAAAHLDREAPLARYRSGEGVAVGRAEDRPVAGAGPGRYGPAGAHFQSRRHHRRARRGQDDNRQCDSARPVGKGYRASAVRADRPAFRPGLNPAPRSRTANRSSASSAWSSSPTWASGPLWTSWALTTARWRSANASGAELKPVSARISSIVNSR